ncbi:hypothetical protein WY13_01311 [Clostridium ljungdahlii]|uniref:Uncharacterized protein n=1 Tax=Clostridium ljungdahlii TaxID=1538 RepID=A0A168R9S4_9CLOT|nr:hypothetical protein WY13_01311 [Clostridium ljungdahlii]
MLDFANIIFDICYALSSIHNKDIKENDYRLNYKSEEISELLLRLYDQSFNYDEKIFYKCLNAWDVMFESGILHARNLTRKIDSQ